LNQINTKRDRLIRFGHVEIPGMPAVLSFWDKEKNLILIDRLRAMSLPPSIQNQLMFTEHEYTKVNADNSGFEAYLPDRNAFLSS
jgi:hypothetical protein